MRGSTVYIIYIYYIYILYIYIYIYYIDIYIYIYILNKKHLNRMFNLSMLVVELASANQTFDLMYK